MTREQLDAIVHSLTLLLVAYEPSGSIDLDTVDNRSYAAGFRAGARSAYADAVCRLRELTADEGATVTRIGAAS